MQFYKTKRHNNIDQVEVYVPKYSKPEEWDGIVRFVKELLNTDEIHVIEIIPCGGDIGLLYFIVRQSDYEKYLKYDQIIYPNFELNEK